jgi:hypothetical protein
LTGHQRMVSLLVEWCSGAAAVDIDMPPAPRRKPSSKISNAASTRSNLCSSAVLKAHSLHRVEACEGLIPVLRLHPYRMLASMRVVTVAALTSAICPSTMHGHVSNGGELAQPHVSNLMPGFILRQHLPFLCYVYTCSTSYLTNAATQANPVCSRPRAPVHIPCAHSGCSIPCSARARAEGSLFPKPQHFCVLPSRCLPQGPRVRAARVQAT